MCYYWWDKKCENYKVFPLIITSTSYISEITCISYTPDCWMWPIPTNQHLLLYFMLVSCDLIGQLNGRHFLNVTHTVFTINYQCCRNTLEFCQTSVWQNSRFCRTEQKFCRTKIFIKPIVKLCSVLFSIAWRKKLLHPKFKVLRVPTKTVRWHKI